MKHLYFIISLTILSALTSCFNTEEGKRQKMQELCDSATIYANNDLREKSTSCCEEGIKLAIELNDDSARAIFEDITGRNLFAIENYDASIMHFEHALQQIGIPHSAKGMIAKAHFFMDIAHLHKNTMDFELAYSEYDSAKVYVLAAGHVDKNVEKEFNSDSLIGRIFIHQTQALYRSGQTAKAKELLGVFLRTDYAKTYEGLALYSSYLITTKRYEEAKDILLRIKEENKSFTPSSTDLLVSDNIAYIHYLLGEYKESYEEYDNYERLRHNRQKSFTNNQLVYQCNNIEKEYLHKNFTQEKEKANLYLACFIVSLLLCLLLFICLYIVWKRHKNFIRYESLKQHYSQPMYIDEEYLTMKIKEVLGDAKTQNKLDKKSKEELAAITAKEIKEDTYKKNAANSFIEAVKENNLYLDPDFKREDLITELNLRKSSFNADFESVTGESPANFIQRLRLEYAAKLLKEENNFTIDAIAYESGFTSRSTFYRIFADLYGMSPAEYRAKNQMNS